MSAGPALYYHFPLESATPRRVGITQSMSRRGQQGHACTGPQDLPATSLLRNVPSMKLTGMWAYILTLQQQDNMNKPSLLLWIEIKSSQSRIQSPEKG